MGFCQQVLMKTVSYNYTNKKKRNSFLSSLK